MDASEIPHEFLFSVTVYRDGTLEINGHGRHEALPDILRMIAQSLENGSTRLGVDEDGYYA
jgi:ribonuclease HIII